MDTSKPRWFWWSADRLTYRWQPLYWGGDEWGRRDLGIRLPGGVLFLALWRFRDFNGPCVRCGQWEPTECWIVAPNCAMCESELIDYDNGCICPSRLSAECDEWPAEDCPLHLVEMAP